MGKKLFKCAALLLVFSFLVISAAAHTTSQSGILDVGYIGENYDAEYIGGENVGWAIMEDCHSGTTEISFRFVNMTQAKKNMVLSGAQMWCSVATFSEDSNSESFITATAMGNNGIIAFVASLPEDIDATTGHRLVWTMGINTFYDSSSTPFNGALAAHELGHVIGLTDLYATQNNNKIMCGYAGEITATSPTYYDLWGAKVILGLHTTHTFATYQYWGHIGNKNYHSVCCLDCRGISTSHFQCVYLGTSNRCTSCGTPKDFVPTT